ncbi:hypothetical protein P154DRAFT_551251 [Amniculicola lignicola CBS 123094]|uniref:Calcineurin-like phosphoesterase domain-containing protein n=1 Tax=Amniculicola lignicola CBS 123094 TaxID=1392246 RepID=A0A6A5WVX1_9PLEO|nr:hypothetical protein P154DRAFT_551251 [Amniculicola lignicola CBS 123094]
MPPFPPLFQIHSDLHLETPLARPSYAYFSCPTNFPLHASNLFLLGDIGYVRDASLFTFLTALLQRTPNLKIFYVLGNHEAYGVTLAYAKERLRAFEREVRRDYGERFWFMDRRRVDLSPRVTVLGCTLWTSIPGEAARACAARLTDFNIARGIKDRVVDEHNADHVADLAWLNAQVGEIEREGESGEEREVVILTHHCPTVDERGADPRRGESEVRVGFATDLSVEVCWRSRRVKMWAFGHTHDSCCFYDEEEGGKKLVIANQKGYAGLGGQGEWVARTCVVEAGEEEWKEKRPSTRQHISSRGKQEEES